jgi:hypothetical protein
VGVVHGTSGGEATALRFSSASAAARASSAVRFAFGLGDWSNHAACSRSCSGVFVVPARCKCG